MVAPSALRLTPGVRPALPVDGRAEAVAPMGAGPASLATAKVRAALRAAFGRPCRLTVSGRAALYGILSALRLRPDDEIWISTTLGARDRLVSPCVTATIARCCRFAFAPGPRTAAALVIHDFGVPHPALDQIADRCRRHGWPLIEDAAHAFASVDARGRRMGAVGDYALFSLPKFFPLARGGLLLGDVPADAGDRAEHEAITAELGTWLPFAPGMARCRQAHWQTLDRLLGEAGLSSALPLPAGAVPSLYALRTSSQFAMLRRLRADAIETGPDACAGYVFLPCHQYLAAADLARIAKAVIGDRCDGCTRRAPPPTAPRTVSSANTTTPLSLLVP